MRSTSLAWVLGAFLAGAGTLMLVAPHRFSAPTYDLLRPALPWWGVAFGLAGASLLASPVFSLSYRTRIPAHVLAAGTIAALSVSFMNAGVADAAAAHALIAAVTLYAGTAPRRAGGGDLLACALAGVLLLHGVLILAGVAAIPQAVRDPFYDVFRAFAVPLGALSAGAGAALLAAQAPWRMSPAARAAAHVAGGVVLIAWAWLAMLPNQAWTGVALYAGAGVLAGLLPWLAGAAPLTAGSSSLRARLALALAAAAAVPLVFAATLIARQEEQGAIDEALARQQTLAEVLAQDTAQYIGLHRNAVGALARQLTELSLDLPAQAALLRSAGEAYPAFGFIGAYNQAGAGMAESDPRAPEAIARLSAFEDARSTGAPAIEVLYRPELSPGPVFALSAPIVRNERFAGVVLGAVESTRLAALLAAPHVGSGGEAYLVDARGRAIAHPDTSLAAALADFSTLPPVQAILAPEEAAPTMRYRGWGGERLVGYARIPDLGWGVVVERPVSLVLVDSYLRRDLIFALLLLAIATAGAAGWLAAGQLTRSLSALARAADALATEDLNAPLPRSTTAELARVATAFGAMRDRLAARTAEREEAIRMRDNVLGTVSHDLKSPLTSISLRAHVLQDEASELLQATEAAAAAGLTGATRDATRGRAITPEDTVDRLAMLADGTGRILATANRMQSMIDELVDTARLHSGQRLDLKRRPVDLVALTTLIADEFRQTADRHRVVIDVPDEDLIGVWDHARLERVLQNLVGNAIKYSPEGGSVTLTVRRGPAQAAHAAQGADSGHSGLAGSWASVSVSDEGLGIPAEDVPNLFRRFFRASNVTGRIRGTGLGLYSARLLVEQHGGRLDVQSRVGHGSTFTITLPLSSTPPPSSEDKNPRGEVEEQTDAAPPPTPAGFGGRRT